MRVSKVSCQVNLVRLYFLEQSDDDIYVRLCPLPFLYSSCLVERQVQEMGVRILVQSE